MLLNRIAVKAAFFINGFILANWVSRLPRIQELYDADKGTIGTVLLAESIGATIAMPFTGWLIIRNGSRRLTLFSAIMYSAIVPAIPFMSTIQGLFVLYFIMGIITGVFDVAMNSQAVMVEQQYKKPIMTSFHALFSIGMTLGAWCGALFAELNFDLPRHLLIISGCAVAVTLWISRNLIHDRPVASARSNEPMFRLPSAALISIGIITFCCMLGEGAMANWSVFYMEDIAHSSKTLAPIGLAAFASAMTLGRLFGDKARAALGDKKMIVAGGLLSTLGVLLAVVFPFAYSSIAGFLLVGLGLSTIVPIAYSIAGNTKGLPHGVGLAMVTTVGYSGFMFGPPIIGFVADWTSLRYSMALVVGLFITMTILGIRYSPDKGKVD